MTRVWNHWGCFSKAQLVLVLVVFFCFYLTELKKKGMMIKIKRFKGIILIYGRWQSLFWNQ